MAVESSSSSFPIRQLNNVRNALSKVYARLSSGSRINSAADDAAGLSIASSLSSFAGQRSVAIRNAEDGISAGAIAESALGTIGDISSRISELAVQASNGTLDDTQRAALQEEVSALQQEASRIASTTTFNGRNLLTDGNSVSYQVGTGQGADSQITVEGTNVSSQLSALASIDVSTQAGAQAAITTSSSFLNDINSVRGRFGAAEARLTLSSSNNAVQRENELAAAGRIRDADIATEVTNLARLNILSNSASAVAAQASKLNADTVLKLLS